MEFAVGMRFAVGIRSLKRVTRITGIIGYTLLRAQFTNITTKYRPHISGLPGNNLKISVIIKRNHARTDHQS